jgi:hypothetical protein
MVPEKVGLKAIQRNDLDYEFTIVFDIDTIHNAKATKDRTGLFVNTPEFKISSSTGMRIRNWCDQDSWRRKEEIQQEVDRCESIEALRHVYSKYPDLQEKIKPLIMEKKKKLESIHSQIIHNSQIIQQSKISKNGVNNS